MQIITIKEIKGVSSGVVIPKGTTFKALEIHLNKYMVEHKGKSWFLYSDQAKPKS